MSIETRIAQMTDYALKIQGLADEVLQELGSAGFKPVTDIPSAPPKTPLMPTRLDPFPPEAFIEKNYVTLKGEVVSPAEVREVETQRGPTSVANIFLTDGTKQVRVGIWGDLIAQIEGLDTGQAVTITNLGVKPVYDGIQQLSSTKNTKITV